MCVKIIGQARHSIKVIQKVLCPSFSHLTNLYTYRGFVMASLKDMQKSASKLQ